VYCRNPKVIHKIGASIDWAGPVSIGGEFPDLSGWTASSRLEGLGFEHAFSCALSFDGEKTNIAITATPGEQTP
jgi:hypothetical protein